MVRLTAPPVGLRKKSLREQQFLETFNKGLADAIARVIAEDTGLPPVELLAGPCPCRLGICQRMLLAGDQRETSIWR